MSYVTSRGREGKLQKHTVMVRRKVATVIAFSTTILLICIESAKSFTIPNAVSSLSLSNDNILSSTLCSKSSRFAERFKLSHLNYNFDLQKFTSTSLRMSSEASKSPAMLDMKTSIGAFAGGWYDELDPVARPPAYSEDDVTDYTFANRSDSWSTSNLDNYNDSYTTMASPPDRNRITSERANPGPIRTIRRLAGWVFRNKPEQQPYP